MQFYELVQSCGLHVEWLNMETGCLLKIVVVKDCIHIYRDYEAVSKFSG